MKNSREKKSFLGKLIEKLDKKMEEKIKIKPCCCNKQENKDKSCCD
jgi:hypothetical protein